MVDPWGHLAGLGFIPKLASPALILVSSTAGILGVWGSSLLCHIWKVVP